MGPWDRETVDGGRYDGATGLEVTGGEGCAAVVILGCMVVGLFTWYSRIFRGGFWTDFVLREFFGSYFREVLTTNLH